MIILGHCCTGGRSHHVCPLIYTLSMPTVIISYIMANSFLINLCNALSDSHGISDVGAALQNKCDFWVSGHPEVFDCTLAPFAKYRGLEIKVLPLSSQRSVIQDHDPNKDIKKGFDVVHWCMPDLEVTTAKLDRSDLVCLVNTTIFRLFFKRARDLLK